MGMRERWNTAVNWVAGHLALATFAWAAGGAVLAGWTASMSVLSAYAPFSYVIAGFGGAILATGSLWSVWAFGRWLRHGANGSATVPINHVSPIDVETELSTNSNPQSGASDVGFESPDIVEAKLRLCEFVMNTLSPAINHCRLLVSATGLALQYIDANSPQASYANTGFQRCLPAAPSFETFADRQAVRTSALVDIERKALSLLISYVAAVTNVNKVVAKMDGGKGNVYTRGNLAKEIKAWLPTHHALLASLERISGDVYFPRIKAEWQAGTYRLEKSPLSVFDNFLLGESQSGS